MNGHVRLFPAVANGIALNLLSGSSCTSLLEQQQLNSVSDVLPSTTCTVIALATLTELEK